MCSGTFPQEEALNWGQRGKNYLFLSILFLGTEGQSKTMIAAAVIGVSWTFFCQVGKSSISSLQVGNTSVVLGVKLKTGK